VKILRPLTQTVRRYTDSVSGFPIAPGFSRGKCTSKRLKVRYLPSPALAGEGKYKRREGPILVTPG